MIYNILKTANAYENTVIKTGQVFLTTSQLANRLGVSRTTIWRYLKNDTSFPRPHHFGSMTRRWNLSEIETWENSRSENHTPSK